ncbi:MAG: phosphoribosylanthranilate isomerase [Planctomycetota bacterium]|nr:MAG: phosphoribosylanthranilate isomerase [Planctomycetota bacterium]
MRVKICGITYIADARAAVEAGADAIGLNFVGGPRKIDPVRAGDILHILPALITPVALVKLGKGRIPGDLAEFLNKHRVTDLQLYGDVNGKIMTRLSEDGFRPIPVIKVKDEQFVDTMNDWLSDSPDFKPPAVVLDAYNPNIEGGSGKTFRWAWVAEARESGKLSGWPPIILAGGLNPANVAEAVRIVRPFAVDVSSGVEKKDAPGKKDAKKMQQFVYIAKSLDKYDTT